MCVDFYRHSFITIAIITVLNITFSKLVLKKFLMNWKSFHVNSERDIWDVENILNRDNTVCRFGIFLSWGMSMKLRLRELRREKRITQWKLAMDLDMSQNTISRYETGAHEPGINELILLADYFQVSIDYLVKRTDNPKMYKGKKD